MKGVKAADVVTGPYDIIAVAEMADLNAIGDLVTGGVQHIPGVYRTLTCVVL
ncbi:MAG: Lrp/AsnC family transcriptional regulator [Dehalococcoidia bacterium]|nr:Lrp/AsnC family transcriptional regulator [Dehalococcoidia bacterium]